MDQTVVVAGAGRCGLHVSRMLAERGLPVTVVERLPCPGGQEPEPDADRLARAAERAGVRFLLGTLAVSLLGHDVDTLGIPGAQRLPASVLVVATGSRPATPGELGITGDRCAGILPGSAAVHLIESGVLPGWHPVVVGGGDLAEHCITRCLRAGSRSVSVVRPAQLRFAVPAGVHTYDGWRLDSIHGWPRVSRVTLSQGQQMMSVHADAVIIAQDRRPMRNIENALHDGGIVVGCHSAADPKTDEDATATAARALAQVDGIVRDSRAAAGHGPPGG